MAQEGSPGERDAYRTPRTADFGIVTALRDEMHAVLAALGPVKEVQLEQQDIRYYYLATVPCLDGSDQTVACVLANEMGQQAALNATRDLMAAWNPRHVLLVGIAGGIAQRGVKQGDVIVPRRVHYYEPGKLILGGRRERGPSFNASARLQAAVESMALQKREEWHRRIRVRPPERMRARPAIHTDELASGEEVWASMQASVVREVLGRYDKVIAVENEAAGVFNALHEGVHKADVLVIKAASDLVDKKDDRWRSYSASVAAAFAVALIEKVGGRWQDASQPRHGSGAQAEQQPGRERHISFESDLGHTADEHAQEAAPESDLGERAYDREMTLDAERARELWDRMPMDEVPKPVPSLDAPAWIPYASNPTFVGRDAELQALARMLKEGRACVIHGTGGCGKTQLAVEFVHRYGPYFAGGVFWLSFAEPAAIPGGVVRCGSRMKLRDDFHQLPQPDRVELVQSAWEEPLHRLLVFDACEDEELVGQWLPKTGESRVLITSRRGKWHPTLNVGALPLGELDPEGSVDLLKAYLGTSSAGDDEDALVSIADQLGYLPLALHVAGSYLRLYGSDVTPAQYLELIRRPGFIAHLVLTTEEAVSPTGHDQSVAATFALSYERLDPTKPLDNLARALAHRAARFTIGQPIPRDILLASLREPGTWARLIGGLKQLLGMKTSTDLWPQALTRLVNVGLLEELGDGTLHVHPLVAQFLRDIDVDQRSQAAVERALTERFEELREDQAAEPALELEPHLRGVVGLTQRPSAGALQELLDGLLTNYGWTWHEEAISVFESLDTYDGDPFEAVRRMSPGQIEKTAASDIPERAHRATESLRAYVAQAATERRVAYFSAEFGIHECLRLYAGELGLTAGDHLKAASDLNVPLVGVGLLYRRGYFTQRIDDSGLQREEYPLVSPLESGFRLGMDLSGRPVRLLVPLGNHDVHIRVWQADIGRVPLYLLDTDLDDNAADDRFITSHLYGGDPEMRLRQEIVLGIGGLRALRALGYDRLDTFHLNEGHSAFLCLEAIAECREPREPLERGRARAASRIVFTTHTPVRSGHDSFDPRLIDSYLGTYAKEELKCSTEELLALGGSTVEGPSFSMTELALDVARSANGVSARHGEVCRAMFPGRPVDLVTDGIHHLTWTCQPLRRLYDTFLPGWREDPGRLADSHLLPTEELRTAHQASKALLIETVTETTGTRLDSSVLTLAFGHIFATHMRPGLLFRDPERLARIAEGRMQILIAGKAHPRDEPGKRLIQDIVRLSKLLPVTVVFIPDMDMGLERLLVAGADVWLSTPRRSFEASGTSGMRANINAVLNLSVLDGWWVEGYDGTNGWAVGPDAQPSDPDEEDARDAESLYMVLAERVVPEFYDLPEEWAQRMRRAVATSARFTASRMVSDYARRLYRL